AGLSCVPINWHGKPDEVRYVLDDSRAKVLVAHADLLAAVADRLPPGIQVFSVQTPPEIACAYNIPDAACRPGANVRDWDDWIAQQDIKPGAAPPGASIIYTSGTTGKPKGVKRFLTSPEARQKFLGMIMSAFKVHPEARTIIAGPMYHSAINVYAIGMANAG